MHIYSVLLVSNPLIVPANSGKFCKCSILQEWAFHTESVSGRFPPSSLSHSPLSLFTLLLNPQGPGSKAFSSILFYIRRRAGRGGRQLLL